MSIRAPASSSVETQTSPADIPLSHLDARQLILWARTFAPNHWLALGDSCEEADGGNDGQVADKMREVTFVHVKKG